MHNNITKDDIETLMETVQWVVIGVMNVDGMGDPVKTMREVAAVVTFFKNASADYQDHGIVRLVIDLLDAQRRNGVIGKIQLGMPSQQQIFQQVAKADAVLQGHPDAMAFRSFLYQMAMTIANAHGEDTSRISPQERAFLDALKSKYKGDK